MEEEMALEERASRGWRSILAAVLIVLGLILGATSVVTSPIRRQLTDTDVFVATYAPLAQDPAVQEVLIANVNSVITSTVDIPGLTAQAFDGLRSTGIPNSAATALSLLEGPAARSLQSFVDDVTTEVITSDSFAGVWEQILRTAHRETVATLTGDPGATLILDSEGALRLPLAPIVELVKARLLDDGIRLAALIPATNQTIVLVQISSLTTVARGYVLFVGFAAWLPWIALALLAGGVLLALDRRRALLRTAWGAGLLMVLLGVLLQIGRVVVSALLAPPSGPLSVAAAEAAYAQATKAVVALAWGVGVLAAAIALVTWLAGDGRIPTAVRARTAHWRTPA